MIDKLHNRLSSDYLYTYTSQYDNLKSILENGLRHSLVEEKIPYKKDIYQQNFVVCFCDILPHQADFHKSVYGNYAIAFKKEWGIKNGITPLRYIHENSPGVSPEYSRLKNDFRIARETYHKYNLINYWGDLVVFQKARDEKILIEESIHDQQKINPIDDFLQKIEEDYEEISNKIGDETLIRIINHWILPLIHSLETSINELERRDSYIRIYKDDFRRIKDKVLYDEREWRSVKYIDEVVVKKDPNILKEAINNKHLPPEYNLLFTFNDIHAIIVETETEKKEIKEFIKYSTKTHLKGLEITVVTFNEHILEDTTI
jgi:hypothetical protein